MKNEYLELIAQSAVRRGWSESESIANGAGQSAQSSEGRREKGEVRRER